MPLEIGNRRCYLCVQRYILVFIFISFCLGILMGVFIVTRTDLSKLPEKIAQIKLSNVFPTFPKLGLGQRVNTTLPLGQGYRPKEKPMNPILNYNVHVFYYAWYRNPRFDEKFSHWNHRYIPHWQRSEVHKYPTGFHIPPKDIASNFYPSLGCYSSTNPDIVTTHMWHISQAGIGVLVVSWYPPNMADENGTPVDPIVSLILDEALKFDIKVTFLIEPFIGRSAETMRNAVSYIIETYSHHPAFYRHKHRMSSLPLFYVYDSYLIPSKQWLDLLHPNGRVTIRGTKFDALMVGLLVEQKHKADLHNAAFDGFFTYFAADGFSYGSTWKNWRSLAKFAHETNMLFIPSVGPGYIDTSVRPWNSKNTRSRRNGTYYEMAWRSATSVLSTKVISITSFNEWHEGTQIEPAQKREDVEFKAYLTYSPQEADFYLNLTRKFIETLM